MVVQELTLSESNPPQVQQFNREKIVKCNNCGNENSEKAKFCGRCGSKLAVEAPLNIPEPPPTFAPPPRSNIAPPPIEKDSWFLVRQDKEYGPYTKEMLKQHLTNGQLGENESVRNEEGKELRPLSSLVTTSQFDLNKVADKANELAHKTGEAASELLDKAIKNAGPIGGQIKEQIRGKEKIVAGGIVAAILVLAAISMSGGEPSSGEMEKAVEKVAREQLKALQGVNIDYKILKFKKISCTKADKGGYYCVSEAEIYTSGPMGSGTQHLSETNYYFKTSDGWSVTKN